MECNKENVTNDIIFNAKDNEIKNIEKLKNIRKKLEKIPKLLEEKKFDY